MNELKEKREKMGIPIVEEVIFQFINRIML